jgi:predicted dehydrogenase
MTQPIRWGILGCARIAKKSVIPAILDDADSELAAIASRRGDVAGEWARQFGAARSYDDYDALLADRDVEAVYIPATGEQHHPLTIAAARAGKHVLCEKPLATSLTEAEEMVAACRNAGVLLMEAFMWRHHARTERTSELLAEGAIGDLRLINVSFSFRLDAGDWRMRPERGGGAMWDLGCYGVNAARFFTDAEPTSIHSRAHFGPTGIDLSMQLALQFPGDVLAHIDCSFEVPWRCRLELVGTRGRIEWATAFQHWDGALQLDTASDWTKPPQVIACDRQNQYARQVQAFCASIRAGRLLAPAEDGLANTRVLETALRTAEAARTFQPAARARDGHAVAGS